MSLYQLLAGCGGSPSFVQGGQLGTTRRLPLKTAGGDVMPMM